MKVRPRAEFRTNIPNDQVEFRGKIVQPAGRAVGDALAQIGRRLGYWVCPPDFEKGGWNLEVEDLLGRIDYIGDDRYAFVLKRSWRRVDDKTYLDILSRFAEGLAADPRFHDIRWHDETQTRDAGAERPVVQGE